MTRSEPFIYIATGRTDPGRVRDLNQDSFITLPEFGVFVVADGAGGHQRGDTASQAIVDAIGTLAYSQRPDDLAEWVRLQLLEVNHRLIELARETGPGTVIGSTVAALVAEGRRCVCLWAGDSRIYGMRRGGNLVRLTRDHSQVEELVEQGILTASQAMQHPNANIIYRAVGMREELELEAVVYDVFAHDKFMLCSDGLTKEVTDDEIAPILAHGSCSENCNELIDRALARNCRDNIAVVVVEVGLPDDDERTVPVPVKDTSRRSL